MLRNLLLFTPSGLVVYKKEFARLVGQVRVHTHTERERHLHSALLMEVAAAESDGTAAGDLDGPCPQGRQAIALAPAADPRCAPPTHPLTGSVFVPSVP
jgi:hypothetical protein